MKKETMSGWIVRHHSQLSNESNEACRLVKRDVLEQCETWLFGQTWAQMRAPVQEPCASIEKHVRPLAKKEHSGQLSRKEASLLVRLRARREISGSFLSPIAPTARQAEIEAADPRQRERARREASPDLLQTQSQSAWKHGSEAQESWPPLRLILLIHVSKEEKNALS